MALPAFTSLSEVTTEGAGDTKGWEDVYSGHVMSVRYTGGGLLTAVTIALEGSLDHMVWYEIGRVSGNLLSNFPKVADFQGQGAFYTRLNVLSLTGGGSPVITGLIGVYGA